MLSASEEQALIAEFKETQSPNALDRVTKAYYRVCFSLASNYSENEKDIEDLAQEASMGIARAMLCYDPTRGVKFSTYMRKWLQTFISAAASKTMADVSIPARAFMDAKMGRIPEGRNDPARNAAFPATRLDAPLAGDDNGETIVSRLQDTSPSPEDFAIAASLQKEAQRQVGLALHALTDRERLVVLRRRLTEYPETLEEIAVDLKVTRERVRQIEVQALEKMRDALQAAGLRGDLWK
jgi:RNA polymerase sigma-32 factor